MASFSCTCHFFFQCFHQLSLKEHITGKRPAPTTTDRDIGGQSVLPVLLCCILYSRYASLPACGRVSCNCAPSREMSTQVQLGHRRLLWQRHRSFFEIKSRSFNFLSSLRYCFPTRKCSQGLNKRMRRCTWLELVLGVTCRVSPGGTTKRNPDNCTGEANDLH